MGSSIVPQDFVLLKGVMRLLSLTEVLPTAFVARVRKEVAKGRAKRALITDLLAPYLMRPLDR